MPSTSGYPLRRKKKTPVPDSVALGTAVADAAKNEVVKVEAPTIYRMNMTLTSGRVLAMYTTDVLTDEERDNEGVTAVEWVLS